MKIKNTTNKPPSQVKGGGKSGAVSSGKKSGAAGGSQSVKAVNVSSTDQISSRMSSDAAQRADRVAQLKLEVESGNYEMDSEKTADKLVDSLTDYSLA